MATLQSTATSSDDCVRKLTSQRTQLKDKFARLSKRIDYNNESINYYQSMISFH